MATDERKLGVPVVIECDRLPALHVMTARTRVRSPSLELPRVRIVMTRRTPRRRPGHPDRYRLCHPLPHRHADLLLIRVAIYAAGVAVTALKQEARPRVIEGHVKPSRQRVTRNAALLS